MKRSSAKKEVATMSRASKRMNPAGGNANTSAGATTAPLVQTSVAPNLNLIGGKWVPAAAGETFQDRNPANTDELIGVYPRSREADVAAAVAAAKSAFES